MSITFRFQVENYCSILDREHLEELKMAAKHSGPMDFADFSDEAEHRAISLFAMLSTWTQEFEVCVKLSKTVVDRNGYELWRLLHEQFMPETVTKGLQRRRAILNPKFPGKEADFGVALADWEADMTTRTKGQWSWMKLPPASGIT